MSENSELINLNIATLEQLQQLPGIGQALSERIVKARPFNSLDDLTRVQGINTAVIERLSPHLTLESTFEELDIPDQPPAEIEEEQPAISIPIETVEETAPEPVDQVLPVEEIPAPPILAPVEEKTPTEEIEEIEAIPDPIRAQPISDELAPATPKEMPEAPGAPEHPAAAPPASKGGISLSAAVWIAIASSFVTLILSVALTLGILSATNGGLRYARSSEAVVMQREIRSLAVQVNSLETDLNDLRVRVDNISALAGRVKAAEEDIEELSDQIEQAALQSAEFARQLENLSQTLEKIEEDTKRFDGFLNGLRQLLEQLSPSE
jgi:prefoldin subunit 5